jgi:fructosamine-3-kinase
LALAAQRGATSLVRHGEQLRARLPAFFSDYRPAPALLHGDLWSGNFSALSDGTPVVFDPASYYGDREADLAMTELFGGFDQDFYAAYRAAWPPDPGYAVRKSLYNLYHVLNHDQLFGGGYGRQAGQMIARLLAEAR